MIIYSLKIQNQKLDCIDLLYKLISTERQGKISAYKNKQTIYKSILTELFMKFVLANESGYAETDVNIAIDSHGKPFWKEKKDHYFNVSHSDEWIVCITDCSPVGIDIEEIKTIDELTMQYCCSTIEYEYILQEPSRKKVNFITLWTLKEALGKYLGKGLTNSLKKGSFIFNSTTNLYRHTLHSDLFFYCFDLINHHQLTICSQKENATFRYLEIREELLIDHFLKIIKKGYLNEKST